MKRGKTIIHEGSFRDPDGFLFYVDEEIYRQVNLSASDDYDLLKSSGLYETLVGKGLLIRHEEVEVSSPRPEKKYRIIKPERVGFLSYPYEWSFSQLKDAALLTLEIQLIALDHGMCLKDASAYNVQFNKGKPIFIDTLSLEEYREGRPWVAYRQFCQHFLAPLALMALVDVRIGRMAWNNIDGIPLDLANALLRWKILLDPKLMIHLCLHARAQKKYSSPDPRKIQKSFPLLAHRGLVDSLTKAVNNLTLHEKPSGWMDLSYGDT